MEEEFASLPPTALVAFGLGLAVIFAVRYLGILSGEKATGSDHSSAAQVAAVIVDPTALNAARDSVVALSKTLADGQSLQKDHVHMLCRRMEDLTKAISSVDSELSSVREEVRIQREVMQVRK